MTLVRTAAALMAATFALGALAAGNTTNEDFRDSKKMLERKVPAPPEHCKKPLHDRQYTGQEGPSAFIQRVCYMVLRLRIINPFAPTTGEKHWGHANKEAGTPAISGKTEHGKSFPRK